MIIKNIIYPIGVNPIGYHLSLRLQPPYRHRYHALAYIIPVYVQISDVVQMVSFCVLSDILQLLELQGSIYFSHKWKLLQWLSIP